MVRSILATITSSSSVPSYIWRLESGGAAPGIDLVARLARAMGTTTYDLMPTAASPDTMAVLRDHGAVGPARAGIRAESVRPRLAARYETRTRPNSGLEPDAARVSAIGKCGQLWWPGTKVSPPLVRALFLTTASWERTGSSTPFCSFQVFAHPPRALR